MFIKTKRIGVLLLAISLILWLTAGFSIFYASAEEQGEITLTCRRGEELIGDMDWSIYKVGVRENDTSFAADGDFKIYYDHIDNFSSEHLSDMAYTLENMALLDKLPPLDRKSTDKNGKLTFSELEPGLYLLSGKRLHTGIETYVPSPSLVEITGNGESVEINAKIKKLLTLAGEFTSSSVKKVWDDDMNSHQCRPESVTVEIYKDGEFYESAELNEANNWTYKWEYEEDYSDWRVKEAEVPPKYTAIYRSGDSQYAIVNTFDDDDTNTTETTVATTAKATNVAGESETTASYQENTQTSSGVQSTMTETVKTTVYAPVTTVGNRLPQTGKPGIVVPILALGGLAFTAFALRKRD